MTREEWKREVKRLQEAEAAGPEALAAMAPEILRRQERQRLEGVAGRLNERFASRRITVGVPPEGMEPSLEGVPGMSVGPGGRVRGRAAPGSVGTLPEPNLMGMGVPGGAAGLVPDGLGMDMAAPERDLDRIPIAGARPVQRGVDPWASTSFQERAMERGVLPDTQANLDALGVGAQDMDKRQAQSRVAQGGAIPATEQRKAQDELDSILRGERQETRIQAEQGAAQAERQAAAADKQAEREHERELKELEAQSAEAVANIQAGKPAVIGNGIAMIKQEDGTWKTIIQEDVKKNMNEGKEFTVGTKTFRMAGDNLLMLDEEGGEVNLVVEPERLDPFARMHFQNMLKDLEEGPAKEGIYNMLEADLQARRGGTVRLSGGAGGGAGVDEGPLPQWLLR